MKTRKLIGNKLWSDGNQLNIIMLCFYSKLFILYMTVSAMLGIVINFLQV